MYISSGTTHIPFHWKRGVLSLEIMRLGPAVDHSWPFGVRDERMCVAMPSLSDTSSCSGT